MLLIHYKLFTSDWLWNKVCQNAVFSEIDITMTTINKKLQNRQNPNNDRKRLLRGYLCCLSHPRSREIWPRSQRPVSRCRFSQRLEKEGILDPVARGNVHFQQHAWRYFALKRSLRCSDDRSLLLVKKICDSMGFRVANRLRVDKVRIPGCFSVLHLLRIMKKVTGFTK